MELLIKNRSDNNVRFLREIRDGKGDTYVFCEGMKVIEELMNSRWDIHSFYYTNKLKSQFKNPPKSRNNKPIQHFLLTDEIMSFVSDLNTAPGIIAVAQKPETVKPKKTKEKNPLILILNGIQSPQNVGALLRSAEAAGVHAVWTTPNTANVYSAKAVRGSSGSVFRVPVVTSMYFSLMKEAIADLNLTCIGASQKGKMNYDRFDWTKGVALLMGSEGKGMEKQFEDCCSTTVTIPMKGSVESLNVATAASICLFEASRQRRVLVDV